MQSASRTFFDESLSVDKFPETPKNWTRGRVLGSGGYGKVYLCCDSSTSLLFALKQVDLGNLNSKISKEVYALLNEVRILSKIQHKRIIQYIGCQENEKSLSIFLEFMPGGSLLQHMEQFGPLMEAVAGNYTYQILEGLVFLHGNNISHRDIKAANILRDTVGNIKLTDFGVSKQLQSISCASGLNTTIGTPYWMAPEVFKELGYGHNADLWSVGCTVVEMLTTKPPFFDLEPGAAIYQIVNCKHPDYKLPADSSDIVKHFLKITFQLNSFNRKSAAELLHHSFVTENLIAALNKKKKKESLLLTKLKENQTTIDDQNELIENLYEENALLKKKLDSVTMTSSKEQKIIIIVGRSGNGRRSIGNSILGEPLFPTGTQYYSLKPVIREKDDFKVIVCPFIGDTGDDSSYKIGDIHEATMKMLNHLFGTWSSGIDAIVFVLKYGVRFHKQEKDAVKRVKEIFGQNVFRDFGIIAFSYGDLFDQDNTGEKTFAEWCLQQSGEVKELFEEARYRCVLFNNKEKSKEQLEIQRNNLWHYLSNSEKIYTNIVEEIENIELVKEQKQNYTCGTHVMLAEGKDDTKQEEETKAHDVEENTQVQIH
ncbi:GIMAP protein [Biomphalaria glabrata]|nr:GIMAP Resistant factor [Biomphalaria glabrata]